MLTGELSTGTEEGQRKTLKVLRENDDFWATLQVERDSEDAQQTIGVITGGRQCRGKGELQQEEKAEQHAD